jgi:serine/threonine protein phosphatase PrpC
MKNRPVLTEVASTPVASMDEPSEPSHYHFGWHGGLFAGAWSEVGTNHPNNEDSYRYMPKARSPRFCGVADGVGGGSHGDIASAVLLDHCMAAGHDDLRGELALSQWVASSDEVVRKRIAQFGDKPGAATFVGVWFLDDWFNISCSFYTAHVGDCRIYHLIPDAENLWIDQITLDQTYSNLGLQPPKGGSGDDPARMVGVGAAGTPPVALHNLREGEALLLCSDGLHKFLSDDFIARIIDEGWQTARTEEAICHTLVVEAKAAGSYDDVTALLVMRRPWLGLYFWERLAILGVIVALSLFVLLLRKYAG